MSLGITSNNGFNCALVGVSLANRSYEFGVRVPKGLITWLLELPRSEELKLKIETHLRGGLSEAFPGWMITAPVQYYQNTLIPTAFTVPSDNACHLGVSHDDITSLLGGQEEELFYEAFNTDRPELAMGLLFVFNTWLEMIELCE